MLQHVPRLIQWLGSAPQFSTEQTELCHIAMAKVPYEASNRKGYDTQICRFLDRHERVLLFSAFQMWMDTFVENLPVTLVNDSYEDSETDASIVSSESVGEPSSRRDRRDRTTQSVQSSYPFADLLPKPTANVWNRDSATVPRNKTTAFVLMGLSSVATKLVDIAIKYGLTDLHGRFMSFHRRSKYVQHLTREARPLAVITSKFETWTKVRMQLRSVQDDETVLPLLTVAAIPPGPALPSGLYNFVLVKQPPGATYTGIQGEHINTNEPPF